MRRELLEELPALSRVFGIKPCDIDHMTPREVSEYRAQLQALIQAERS